MTPREISNTRDDRFQDLCKLAQQLGYREVYKPQLFNPNGTSVSDLINLLEDNPGAARAMIDWLANHHGQDEETCEVCGEVCGDDPTQCSCDED